MFSVLSQQALCACQAGVFFTFLAAEVLRGPKKEPEFREQKQHSLRGAQSQRRSWATKKV